MLFCAMQIRVRANMMRIVCPPQCYDASLFFGINNDLLLFCKIEHNHARTIVVSDIVTEAFCNCEKAGIIAEHHGVVEKPLADSKTRTGYFNRATEIPARAGISQTITDHFDLPVR